MSADLVAFLRARLDEDERLAYAAVHAGLGIDVGPDDKVLSTNPDVQDHLATWHPARVLREIEAKRQLICDHEDAERSLNAAGPGTPPHDIMTGATNTLRRMLRLLAAAYADHPEFREEWRP